MSFFKTILKYQIVGNSPYTKWRNLTDTELSQEYQWEWAFPSKQGVRDWAEDAFTSLKDFEKAARQGEVLSLTPDLDKKIEFRSRKRSLEALKKLVGSYKYPRDVDRIVKGLQNDEPIPYPIVLRKPDGSMRVFSGNTRLDVAFILGLVPRVLVVDVPEKVEGSRKARYMEMFKPTTTAQEVFVEKYIRQFTNYLKREDRIMWALRRMRDFFDKVQKAGIGDPMDFPTNFAWLSTLRATDKISSMLQDAEDKDLKFVSELRFNPNWSPEEVLEELEKADEKEALTDRKRTLLPDEDDEPLLQMSDGFTWYRLDSAGVCEREGAAMRHCGNADTHRYEDEILSLRETVKVKGREKEKPHLTFVLNNGFLTQMKGYANKKPDPKFHKHIVALLTSPYVKGIIGGGYGAVNNFSLDDLTDEEKMHVLKVKPTMDVHNYYLKHGYDKFLKDYLKDELEDDIFFKGDKTAYVVISDDRNIADYHANMEDEEFFNKEFPGLDFKKDMPRLQQIMEQELAKVQDKYGKLKLDTHAVELIKELDPKALFDLLASGDIHNAQELTEELKKIPDDLESRVLPQKPEDDAA